MKDHRYDYIETGSLLSIKKNIKNIVIPSEETRYSLYPLDYEEFRWALGDTATLPLLLNTYEKMLHASRYQVSSVVAGEKEERVREILADMQDSMTVYISYHADDPSAGMSLHKDPRRYKLFCVIQDYL